jgi:site-specific recombinase XerD
MLLDDASPALPWTSDPAGALTALLRAKTPSLSPGSLQVYQAMLASALQHLGGPAALAHCGTAEIEEWLQQKVRSTRTSARYLSLLERVFRDMVEHGQRTDNPAAGLLSRLKQPARPLPLALLPGQEVRFRRALPAGSTWRALRDRAVIAVLLDAGLKVHEAQALRVEDCEVDPAGTRLRVREGDLERKSPVAHAGEMALTEWLKLRAAAGPQAWLFPSDRQDTPLHAASIYRIVEKVFKAAGIVLPHRGAEVLRATFAARQFRAGKPLNYVQSCLGHRFPESTIPLKRAALGDRPA